MQQSTIDYLTEVTAELQFVAKMVQSDTSDVLADGEINEVVRHFKQLRDVNATIKEARTALSELEDSLSVQAIPDLMKSKGVKTITVIGTGRCTVSYRYGCTMLDKQRGIEWLKSTGNESLVQETVNSSTLAAFAKNMLEVEGKELPEGIFKTSSSPYTSITKVA